MCKAEFNCCPEFKRDHSWTCRGGGDPLPAKRSRSQSPARLPSKQPRLDQPSAVRLSRAQKEALFDREEVLRRAAAARQVAEREPCQPGLGTSLGVPSLSSRWAPSPGPPGFSRPHDRPPVRSSSLTVDDPGMDRSHSIRHGPLPELLDAEGPRRLPPIGAAARAARPLSAAPHAAWDERRPPPRDRPSSPQRQESFHHAPFWDRPYSPERQDSFHHAGSWDRPYSPERQGSLHRADTGEGLTGRDRSLSSRPWDEAPRSSSRPSDGHGRRGSRHEDDLPPPPLPPPPPTSTSARGSPQVS